MNSNRDEVVVESNVADEDLKARLSRISVEARKMAELLHNFNNMFSDRIRKGEQLKFGSRLDFFEDTTKKYLEQERNKDEF